ncbi:MAG: hypothetical protein WAN11_28010 [Syntrophobacteraceae bacterium]
MRQKIPDVMTLTDGSGGKETREDLARIAETPAGLLTLVATGRYIAEGYDEPRTGHLVSGNADILERDASAIRGQTAPIVRKQKRSLYR